MTALAPAPAPATDDSAPRALDRRRERNILVAMITGLVAELHGDVTSLPWKESTISYARPWRRLTMRDAVVDRRELRDFLIQALAFTGPDR